MISSRLRIVAGVAILAALLVCGVILVPIYWRNYEFGQSLGPIAGEAARNPDDWVRMTVTRSAAEHRLPVKPGNVRVRRSPGRVEIQVPYTVSVDFSIYSVDLHFRPAAHR